MRLLGFIEPVEHIWQIIRRNTIALVDNAHYGKFFIRDYAHCERAAIGRELYSIIHQITYDLRYLRLIGFNHCMLRIKIHIDVYMLCVDARFECKHGANNKFIQIKRLKL